MILRFSSFVLRLTLVVAALALATALAYSSIRNARAVYQAGLGTLAGYVKATQLEPSNPLNWYLLGRYWQYNLEEPDPRRAVQAYRSSLSLDSRSASTWLDLAAAYESDGEMDNARDAFVRAKRAYPISAEVAWRYGNFLLRQGELPLAFAEIRRALDVDPQRAAEAFSRAWRVDPDVKEILDKVLPANPAVYLDAIRELDSNEQLGSALIVWAHLVAIHPRLQITVVFPFTDALLQAHRISDARRVWDEALSLSDTPPAGDPPGSVLWDGGFETGVRGGGFAWFLAPASSGVQTSLDAAVKHSGKQSLRLGFDGKRNVNFADVCHVAEVQPGASYRFSAWLLTQSLTTTQGVRFRLDSRAGSVETSDLQGTQPWKKIELPWTAGKDVHEVRICVCRNPSDDFNARIQGTAWVDDVALVPALPENARP
jgi:tetratricopeptide (TPR) repeat protein